MHPLFGPFASVVLVTTPPSLSVRAVGRKGMMRSRQQVLYHPLCLRKHCIKCTSGPGSPSVDSRRREQRETRAVACWTWCSAFAVFLLNSLFVVRYLFKITAASSRSFPAFVLARRPSLALASRRMRRISTCNRHVSLQLSLSSFSSPRSFPPGLPRSYCLIRDSPMKKTTVPCSFQPLPSQPAPSSFLLVRRIAELH